VNIIKNNTLNNINTKPSLPCPICLSPIINKSILDICEHEFCKECIDQWAKLSSECPCCKDEFKKIIYWDNNSQQSRRVRKRKFKYEDEEEEPWLLTCSENCMICKKNIDEHLLLLCDKCKFNICHTYCAGLELIPDEDWFCFDCRGVKTRKRTQQISAHKPNEIIDEIITSKPKQIELENMNKNLRTERRNQRRDQKKVKKRNLVLRKRRSQIEILNINLKELKIRRKLRKK
jgi:hypothetical protein